MSVRRLPSWCARRRPPKAATEFGGGSCSGLSQRLEVIKGPCYNLVEGPTMLRKARPSEGKGTIGRSDVGPDWSPGWICLAGKYMIVYDNRRLCIRVSQRADSGGISACRT